jgi:hypothetical protein
MRNMSLGAALASLFFVFSSAGIANASGWELATATGIDAGAGHSAFIIQAMVTLPTRCYTARIRSTPITLHTPRSFYVEQQAPSSTCKSTAAYTCTAISPAFPLPIPHEVDVVSKGPKKWKVAVHTSEPHAMPPVCGKT